MDECLVPCDGRDMYIKDNELRRALVDPLPVGCKLVAVFDSCHSASLLDLDHFRCNRVYVPWISKGRRKSNSMWNANVRRPALPPPTPISPGSPLVSSRVVYQSKRVSTKNIKTRRTSIDKLLNPPVNFKRLSIKTQSLSITSDFQMWLGSELSPITRCDSPLALFCEGSSCRSSTRPSSPVERAEVISFSSCKDNQESWEDADGASMTEALIRILRKNPHPSLKSLLTDVSHALHDAALLRHRETRTYKKKLKMFKRSRKRPVAVVTSQDGFEMNNFQDPELASHKPLDMDAPWAP